MSRFALMAVLASTLLTNQALADVITAAEGNAVTMPATEYIGSGDGSQIMGDGTTVWSSTNATRQGGAVFGWTSGYGFSGNGSWFGNPPMAGINSSFANHGVIDSMTFTFASPVFAVGGILNWVTSQSPVTIAVFNASNVLLESLTLSFLGTDEQTADAFYGFYRAAGDISKFVLSDGYIGLRDLHVATTDTRGVPGPIAGAGLPFLVVGAALWMRRRNSQVA